MANYCFDMLHFGRTTWRNWIWMYTMLHLLVSNMVGIKIVVYHAVFLGEWHGEIKSMNWTCFIQK